MILARILQLENLHINNLQIDALRGVTKAFKGSKYTVGDVDELLDKLSDFKDDFEQINDRLSEDLSFQGGLEVSDDELMAELDRLENSDGRGKAASPLLDPTVQEILTRVPTPPTETEQVDLQKTTEDAPAALLPVLS